MKKLRITPIVAALCLLGLITPPFVAADTPKQVDDAQLISALNKKTDLLEQQLAALQAQLKTMQQNQTAATPAKSKAKPPVVYSPDVVYKHPSAPPAPPVESGSLTPAIAGPGPGPIPAPVPPASAQVLAPGAAIPHPTPEELPPPVERTTRVKVTPENEISDNSTLISSPQDYAPKPVTGHPEREIVPLGVGGANGNTVASPRGGIQEPQVQQQILDEPFSLLANAPKILGGMPVVTSPYLGTRSAFDGTDLISLLPNINEGLHLLQERQKIDNVFRSANMCPYLDNPYVDLSGTVQPTFTVGKPYIGPKGSGFDVPTAYLQPMANINKWVTAFMSINLDNSAPGQFLPQQFGPVVNNSRVFMDQAFVTVGNLHESPFYMTMGQLYVPFGNYTTNMVSSPLTLNVGRTKARAVVLGFDAPGPWPGPWDGFDAQVYAFRGNAITSPSSNRVNQYGANFDYAINEPKWNFSIGSGYIANIADSAGMQLNGATSGFEGFAGQVPAGFPNAEVLEHRVPGVDVHGQVGVGHVNLIGEYLTATRAFSPLDLTFNTIGQPAVGARPSAAQVEAAVTFTIYERPTNIAIGYQMTSQALALLEPQKRYTATLNTSIWKDTIESIEFRHDVNYGTFAFATGAGIPITIDGIGLGGSSNTVTFQLAAFF